MRQFGLIVVSLFILLIATSTITYASDDLNGHWAESDIRSLIDKEIMEGDNQGNYFPNRPITRAEFAALLVRALQLPDSNDQNAPFTDVASSEWYYTDVITASENGLINGTGEGTFKPTATINRQEMAEMIKNSLDIVGVTTEASALPFQDSDKIDDWARPSIQNLIALEIIVGVGNSNGDRYFKPLSNASRAEGATVINRMLHTFDQPVEEEYNSTLYDVDFSEFLDIQASVNPKVDGAGRFVASKDLVKYYANSHNYELDSPAFLQFLLLSKSTGLDANEINEKILKGMGTLEGTGEAFVQAGEQYNINEVYLIAHALHETGNGTSDLASGITVNGEETFNMFGIQAFDDCPDRCGSEHAYDEGWFTPEAAIIGGAKFVRENYIDEGQDTLYKMRWNPSNPGTHQYATHVSWAVLQTDRIKNIYDQLDTYEMVFDIPEFNDQPESSPKPPESEQYAVDTSLAGVIGETTTGVNFRTYPSTATTSNIISTLSSGSEVEIIGENGGWYKINANGDHGWVHGDYIELANLLQVKDIGSDGLNVRSAPNGTVLGSLYSFDIVIGVVDEDNELVKDGDWFKIKFESTEGWVHGDHITIN